jgi:hypothetical protein
MYSALAADHVVWWMNHFGNIEQAVPGGLPNGAARKMLLEFMHL